MSGFSITFLHFQFSLSQPEHSVLASRFLLRFQNIALVLLLESGQCGLPMVFKGFDLITLLCQPVRLDIQESHRVEEHLGEPEVWPRFPEKSE